MLAKDAFRIIQFRVQQVCLDFGSVKVAWNALLFGMRCYLECVAIWNALLFGMRCDIGGVECDDNF